MLILDGCRTDCISLYPQTREELAVYADVEDIRACQALHAPHSFCIGFKFFQTGFKLIYTGDTRPQKDLITLGTHWGPPDLLIHEATVEHHMLADAKLKRHSTFTEAIQDGKLMEAKFTLLTHFSQRYAKVLY